MAQLFTLPKQAPLVNTVVSPGAKAEFFLTGTTTQADVYTNGGLSVPHTNPVIADADGVFPVIYLDEGIIYKMTLYDANDVLIYTADPANSSELVFTQTDEEAANGVTPVNTRFFPGDVRRYGAVIDATTDDTTAFNNAVRSGHPAFCDVTGTTNIAGTVVLDGDKQLSINAGLNFERQSGGLTTPLLHMYGNKNVFNPMGATIRHDLYSHPDGIIRIGPAAGEVEGGPTDVQCFGNQIQSHFKLLGAWGVTGQDGSVGIYCESIRRKKFTVTNPTYDTVIWGGEILNCDWGIFTSTDFNRNRIRVTIRQFGTGAVACAGSYGNKFDLNIESPQPITPEVWRSAIHLGGQNYLSLETATDPTYGITSTYRNEFNVYTELAGSGTTKARVISWEEPGLTTAEGANEFYLIGQFGGGIGENGTTSKVGIGSNDVDSVITHATWSKPYKIHGWEFRELDDESGNIQYKDSGAVISGSKRTLTQGNTYDLFKWSNLNNEEPYIRINFTAKGSDDSHIGGEMSWIAGNIDGTTQDPKGVRREIIYRSASDEFPAIPVIRTAADTTNTDITVSVAIPDITGTDEAFFEYKAELYSSDSESVNNLDWAADISLLTTSTASVLADLYWPYMTKVKHNDLPSVTSNTTEALDPILSGYDVEADTEYLVEGALIVNSDTAPDIKLGLQASNAVQSIAVTFNNPTTAFAYTQQANNTYGQVATGASDEVISVNGTFTTNASTGGTIGLAWAQFVSNAASTSVLSGSYLKITKRDAKRNA